MGCPGTRSGVSEGSVPGGDSAKNSVLGEVVIQKNVIITVGHEFRITVRKLK